MRIAVAQVEFDGASRAATFQRSLAAIDAAAETDPPPDLVLLPAFHDVPAFLGGTGVPALMERCEGQTVAACGLRARQWGIYIATAIAEAGRDKPYVTGILVDRDGDTRLTQRQCHLNEAFQASFASGDGFETEDILLGRMAFLVGADVLEPAMWDVAKQAGAGLILSPACWGTCASSQRKQKDAISPEELRVRIAAQAKRCSLQVAVADVVTRDRDAKLCCPGISLVIDGEGNTRAMAESHVPGLIWAELKIPPKVPVGDSQV